MAYTSCKLLIPAQYKYGLSRDQLVSTVDYWSPTTSYQHCECFDMNMDTNGFFTSTTGFIHVRFGQACALNQLFVTWEGRNTDVTPPIGTVVPVRGTTALTINSFNPEYPLSSYWTVGTGFCKDATAPSTDISSILLNLENSTTDDDYELDIQTSSILSGKNINAIVWSETFAVPLWDRGASFGMSFSQPDMSGAHENLFNAWKRSKTFQVEMRRSLKWSGLTDAQFTVFENAFLAFGGSLKKPFILARITDAGAGANNEAEFYQVAMTSSPQITKDSSGLYSVTLELVEMKMSY